MSALLRAMGWSKLDRRSKRVLKENPKAVLVFPHTSFADFFLFTLYYLSEPILYRRCKIPMNPKFTRKYGPILKKFGVIESTRREERGGGAVDRFIAEVEALDEYLICLSPKGSMDPDHDWRSGFYHLARQLKCPVIPGGLDFERKKVIFNPPFDPSNMTFEEACVAGKAGLSDVIPHYPERSEFFLDPHDASKCTLLSTGGWIWLCIVVLIIIIVIVVVIWWIWRRRNSVFHDLSDVKSCI